jgi:hypothetical protein
MKAAGTKRRLELHVARAAPGGREKASRRPQVNPSAEETLPFESEKEERGVVEVIIRDKARRGFEVWNSTGECLEYVEWPAARVTQKRIDDLWWTLDREDPIAPVALTLHGRKR